MKQIILSIAIFLMIASSKNSSAQSNNDVALNLTSLISSTLKGTAVEAKVTSVNVHAMRDFNRAYKNISDAKWYTTEKGYFVSFDADGKNTKIVYDSRGQRSYAIISYTEAQLDRNVRTQVKSVYFDAAIIGVHQFEFDNATVYVIKMLDQHSKPLTLKVTDVQIEDITTPVKK